MVTELRALAGDLDETQTRVAARASAARDRCAAAAARPRRARHPRHAQPEGRHVLLEVAAAIAGIEGKVLRADLATVGIAARDRITSRSGHPTRLLLDRVARQLGIEDVELAIAPSALRTRVLAQDAPWIIVAPSFVKQPEPVQMAGPRSCGSADRVRRAVARGGLARPDRGAARRGGQAGREGLRCRRPEPRRAARSRNRAGPVAPPEKTPRGPGPAARGARTQSRRPQTSSFRPWFEPSFAPRSS